MISLFVCFVLLFPKVPKEFRGAKTRYRPGSSILCIHPAQTVVVLKTRINLQLLNFMLFALGTTNTPKTNAIREALDACPFIRGHKVQILGYKVASGVPDMPLTLSDLRE